MSCGCGPVDAACGVVICYEASKNDNMILYYSTGMHMFGM